MESGAFLRGMGAGLAVGAVVALKISAKQHTMKTPVGRGIQQAGTRVDSALSDFQQAIR